LSANVQAVAVRDADNPPVIRAISVGCGTGTKDGHQQCDEHQPVYCKKSSFNPFDTTGLDCLVKWTQTHLY
jgi:hypothetical protein